MRVLRWLSDIEILAALRLAALGHWWAAHAAHRSRKLSGKCSSDEALK
jgi:hypothetical protein